MVKSTSSITTIHNPRLLGPKQLALLIGALILALYLRTLAPGLLAGDPGEFQVAAWTLGIAHPTGYPLYLGLGHLWQHGLALLGVSPAAALNAFSTFCSAVAVALTFLLQLRWLPGTLSVRTAAATVGTLFFGLNLTFWNQSVIAEVYSLHMLLVVLLVLATQRYVESHREEGGQGSHWWFYLLCGLVGLTLTHHAMTIWLLIGLCAGLLWVWTKGGYRSDPVETVESAPQTPSGIPWLSVIMGAVIGLIPLLLYLYIPLRSGPEASPWYHQRLGQEILTLYENSWPGFVYFLTGQSISVGFRSLPDALGQISFAAEQWHIHFTWLGLLLMAIGLYALFVQQRWYLLIVTSIYFIGQQGFNLFYAIGDIYVYYIPLYWIGTLWISWGAASIGGWLTEKIEELRQWQAEQQISEKTDLEEAGPAAATPSRRAHTWLPETAGNASALLLMLLAFVPLQTAQTYFSLLDQSGNTGTRARWEEILAAGPPDDAILVSNDRNEIVPLFYLQHVEGRATGMRGLFPLISPEGRFADIGSTIQTALASGNQPPVVLIKPMDGLETRFELEEGDGPLVNVLGEWGDTQPQFRHDLAYGPLTFLGYDWSSSPQDGQVVEVALQWRVEEPIEENYTTSAQLFDDAGERIVQDDRPPGRDYYPTSLWKPGEILRDAHYLNLPPNAQPKTMLITMYTGDNFEALSEAIEIPLNQ